MRHMGFNGVLTLKDSCYEFELKINTGRSLNLTRALEKIYKYDPKWVKITIESESKQEFNERGQIYKDKNKFGIYSLHINDSDLEDCLFNLVGREVVINIEESGNIYG